jgi:uncharacterized membrane protein
MNGTIEAHEQVESLADFGIHRASQTDTCYVNAMSHFYRGELGRIMIWRQRLDVTTT